MLQYQSTPRCKRKKVGAVANAEAAINVELTRNAEEDINEILEVDEAEVLEDDRNPAQTLQTVSAHTYQNYKSALKWWREYACEAIVQYGLEAPYCTMASHSFRFPSFNVNVMWNLWFLGDASKSVGPFRYINPKFDLPLRLNK